MAIDKGLYAAPLGIDQEEMDEPQGLEIEIEDPESVTIGTEGFELEIRKGDPNEDDFDANIAEEMGDSELALLASELLGDFEDDISSRKDWMQTYVDGIDLLGMKLEERTEPWAGACGVTHPLLSEALVKFQSETIMETFPAAGPVKITNSACPLA